MATPPRARVERARIGTASTWTLVRDVYATAQTAAEMITWPGGIARRDAGEVMHAFTVTETRYKAERDGQVIRMPYHATRSTVDCKSTAVLIAAMCLAAGRKVALRFVQFDEGPTHWQHVYAVVDGTPCDPLLRYGNEFPYIRAITLNLHPHG